MKERVELAKYNKKKCLKCMYHGEHCGTGWTVEDEEGRTHVIYCNYAMITNSTCLQPKSTYKTYDLRGNDYNNCLLFKEGKPRRAED